MAATAHAAFNKAAYFYDIEIKEVPVDPKTYQLNSKLASKYVDKNTICIIGSAPNFCHLVIDDIKSLSNLALKNKTNLHVDCCLGGFIYAYCKELLPKFDF